VTKEEIMQMIEEDVRADIYGDLYGHDRAAESIVIRFILMQAEIDRLKERNIKMDWQLNPDRSGGQFIQDEINDDGWR